MSNPAVNQYIAKRLEQLDRFIYNHECNILEPNFQEQSEYHEAWGERAALRKMREMLGAPVDITATELQKITYRWKDRVLMMSNGPARGMLTIRHDDGKKAAVVVPFPAFDALWEKLSAVVEPENLMGGSSDDAEDYD